MLFNRERAYAVMRQHGLDAVLLSHPNNFVYASDYLVPSTFSFLDRPFLVVLFADRSQPAVAIVPSWDFDDVKRRSWIPKVIGYTEYPTDRDQGFVKSWRAALRDVLAEVRDLGQLGVEERHLPKWILDELKQARPTLALVDATSIVRDVRIVKTSEEIRRLRRATEIMSGAVDEIFAALSDGVTEREVARIYATSVSRQGGENISNFVLGFGPASAFSHCIPEDKALAPGDMVRFDLGARYLGYYADTAVSRAWRRIDAVSERICRGVLESQRAGAALLGPGVKVSDIYNVTIESARRFIPGFRMEHVGHGMGVEHHENPPFVAASDVRLEPNMVVNVETLFLDPERGGFAVEDTYLITETGAEQWTGFDRAFVVG